MGPLEEIAETQSATGRASGQRRTALRKYTLAIALIVVWATFAYLTGGVFVEPRNFSNLMRQTAVTGVLAVGMLLVILIAQIDLSVGSLVGLTGMLAALSQASAGQGMAVAVVAAVGLGIVIGAVQGLLSEWAEIPSFIVTLGGLLVWRGITQGLSGGNTIPISSAAFVAIGQEYLPRWMGIAVAVVAVAVIAWRVLRRRRVRRKLGFPPSSAAEIAIRMALPSLGVVALMAGFNRYAGMPVPVFIFLLVALAGAFLTSSTVFGRYLYAIGGNAEAARLSGISRKRYGLAAFCIMGGLAGVAGLIYTARVGSASPDAGLLLELDAIAACVIGGASLMGGRGTVLGACLGALFMASLDNGMSLRNVPDFVQLIVKGSILVAAVGFDMFERRRGA